MLFPNFFNNETTFKINILSTKRTNFGQNFVEYIVKRTGSLPKNSEK